MNNCSNHVDHLPGKAVLVICCMFSMISAAFAAERPTSMNQNTAVQEKPECVPSISSGSFGTPSWYEDHLHFCAPSSNEGNGGGSNKQVRRKKRKQQIHRLAEKYVPDGKFSIVKPGAIKGARTMDDPWEVQTSHYNVKTDVSKKAAGEIALLLELLYDSLLRSPFFPDQNFDIGRMPVVVTKNHGELEDTLPQAISSDQRGGVFKTSDKQRLYAHYFVGDDLQLHNVLWQNGTKLFLKKVLNVTPQWFYEGFSQVFAFSKLDKGLEGMSLSPGAGTPRHHLEAIVDELEWEDRGEEYDYLMTFSELIRMEDSYISSQDLAQLWGVMHFLMHWNDGKLIGNMRKYIGHLYRKEEIQKDHVQLFLQMFEFHPKKMRRPWEKYIYGLYR